MFNFRFLENFDHPYGSRSIQEFWRRWHISLSTWFRDYLYIPLGGSRKGPVRTYANLFVVFLLCGVWHGAAWNYVGWGVYYGALLILEKFVWGRALAKAPAAVGHAYTIAVFVLGWSFFWITDPGQLVPYWQAMAGQFGWTGASTFWELTAWEYWPVFIICIIASTPLVPWVKERVIARVEGRKARSILGDGGLANPRTIATESLCVLEAAPAGLSGKRLFGAFKIALDIALLILLLASIAAIVSGSFNPFIYFQF
jgi:alginate O-acetyltransferase complex protein AlgI